MPIDRKPHGGYGRNLLYDRFSVLETVEDIREAIKYIYTLNIGSSSRGRYRHFIKEIWYETHDENNKKDWSDIEWELRNYKVGKRPKYTNDSINDDQYSDILSACTTEKQKLPIEFLAYTGLRISEFADILLSDCKTVGDMIEIVVKTKKTNMTIYKKIPMQLYRRIRLEYNGLIHLFETREGRSYHRSCITRMINTVGKRVGLKISAHSFRHYYVKRELLNGVDPIIVSRSVGHLRPGSIIDNYLN